MKIELVAPDAVFAGTDVPLEVVIRCEQATQITSAVAFVVGTQGWTFRSKDEILHEELRDPDLRVRLLTWKLLSPHEPTHCKFRVALPPNVPPSHAHEPAFASYDVTVEVELEGGRTVQEKFRLPVRAATPSIVTRTPESARTPAARPTDPRLEVSLASTRLVAGEDMVGSVALFHVDDKKPQRIDLALFPMLVTTGKRFSTELFKGPTFSVDVPAGGAGRMLTFAVHIPPTVTPTFFATTHAVVWHLFARAGRLELEMPIEIFDASVGESTAPLIAAPKLADARIAAMLESFAAHHGWQSADATITRADLALGGELQMVYDQRSDGTFLVARCRYPSLGIGLDVTPSSALRQLFAQSISLGVPAWDQRHRVRARTAEQVVAPLRAVVPSLLSSGILGRVVRWTDDELVLEREVVTLDAADLFVASNALVHVAANLRRARDLVPPPLDVDLAAWRALARGWGGELRTGDLGVSGTLDGAPVMLGVRFDDRGAAIALAASVGPTARAARDVTLAVAQPSRGGAPLVADLIAQWPDEIVELRVADGVAHAACAVVDVVHARTLVMSLRAIVGRLEPLASPYR